MDTFKRVFPRSRYFCAPAQTQPATYAHVLRYTDVDDRQHEHEFIIVDTKLV
jgi:hypothetical protein